jgi:Ala-tRNA(Pro) deacylase
MDQIAYNNMIYKHLRDNNVSFESNFDFVKEQGGKSLLLKGKSGFKIFTIRADLEIDNKIIRKTIGSQKLRFATEQELLDIAGVIPGALPPFGRPFLDLDHYLDRSILHNQYIAFNAAIIGKRVRLKVYDYLKIIDTILGDFRKV